MARVLKRRKTEEVRHFSDHIEYRVSGVVRSGNRGRPPRTHRMGVVFLNPEEDGTYKTVLVCVGPGEVYGRVTDYWPTFERAKKFAQNVTIGVD